MSEPRHINWEEVAEEYWIAYCSAMAPHEKGEPPEFDELPHWKQDAIIAGCEAAVTLAVEES